VTWRLARALETLRAELNAKWPDRDHTSDGTIGDSRHAAAGSASDHNPWIQVAGVGVVRALDVDVDGINAAWLFEHLRALGAAGDRRLAGGGYLILRKPGEGPRITAPDFRTTRPYDGADDHSGHLHVSFSRNPAGFDSPDPWHLEDSVTISDADAAKIAHFVWNKEVIRAAAPGIGPAGAGDFLRHATAAADAAAKSAGKAVAMGDVDEDALAEHLAPRLGPFLEKSASQLTADELRAIASTVLGELAGRLAGHAAPAKLSLLEAPGPAATAHALVAPAVAEELPEHDWTDPLPVLAPPVAEDPAPAPERDVWNLPA
jgi:hypothetical protein